VDKQDAGSVAPVDVSDRKSTMLCNVVCTVGSDDRARAALANSSAEPANTLGGPSTISGRESSGRESLQILTAQLCSRTDDWSFARMLAATRRVDVHSALHGVRQPSL
jgi:hypothetical protein